MLPNTNHFHTEITKAKNRHIYLSAQTRLLVINKKKARGKKLEMSNQYDMVSCNQTI